MIPSHLDFRGMIDASPNPYLVLDRDLNIAFANRAYLQSVKRDLGEIVGRWAWEAFPTDPETERQAIASFERVKATRQPDTMALLRFDVPRPEAEGGGFERRWWSITHSPVLDAAGEVALIVQHPIDVTDLERLRDVVTASGDAEIIDLLPAHTGIFARAQSVYEANLALKAESDRLHELFARAPSFMAVLRGPEHVFDLVNAAFLQLIGHRDVVGQPVRAALPEVESQGFVGLLDQAYRTGEPFVGRAVPVSLQATPDAPLEERVLDFVYQPITGPDGCRTGIFVEGSDVTDHVRADAALRESEERYRQIVEGAEDFAIVTLDEHGIITEWNHGAERIMGWPREEAVGQPGAMIFTPEDREAGAPDHEMNRAASDERAVNERWHLRRDGSRFWGSGLMMRLEGERSGYLKIFRDATAEHEVQAALRESEARLRALTDNLPAGMVYQIATGRDGHERRFLYVSQSHEKLTGVPAEAVLADPSIPYNLVLPEHREILVQGEVTAIRDRKPFDVQVQIRRSDGQVRWTRILSAFREQVDGSLIWDGLQIDITEQKEAEARLRDLNETLEARVAETVAERQVLADIVESSSAPTMALGLDFTILAINEANVAAIERVYGQRPKAGDNLLDLLAHMPEHQAQVAATWGRALAGEEFVVMDTFGDTAHERVAFEIRFSVLRDREGRQIGATHTAYDISDRVRAQAELELAQEALRQSQKMEAMGQLTGGVAHDFNNLLTPIIGSLDRLVTRGVGSERERRLIEGALQSAERAKTLVQRLLAFARRQPLQPVAVDISVLVEGMAGLISSTLGPKIDVRVDLDPDLPAARADAHQLEMALLNLAVNARDAMPEGGRLILAAARESLRRSQEAGLRQGHYIRLSVTDTGVGMDPATRERAIEPFFSTKGIGRGTGLGLSMVHGLAAQLGGGLTIQSAPGQGTTIELWLPISAEAASTGEEPSAGRPQVQARGRALLVDDEDLVRMSTADMLADMGFDVLEAASAEDALQLLNEGTAVNLLVTDHLMPGMSGTDLAREAHALRPELPVLIVSGYAEVEGLAPDLPRLVKPFRAAELAERVAVVMPNATATE